MRILYVALRYDYGMPEQGHSFEHYNFHNSLIHMGLDILYFDFMTLMQTHGRQWMNRRLMEVIRAEKPQFLFCVLFGEEIEPGIIREISQNTDTITLNWFCDDHWRFDNFSRHWAPNFNWVVTTAQSALPKYRQLGYHNVIKSQWACNHFSYLPLSLPMQYDVTFIGQPHGNRRAVIESLREAGLNVQVWGSGWEAGRLTQEEMIRVFNQTRINLNLSNASVFGRSRSATERSVRELLWRAFDYVPLGNQIKRKRLERYARLTRTAKYADQIKGRNFEIPGCGGFLLTGRADNLEDYYSIGEEVVCFDDTRDLIEKTRYYLAHANERVAIARAGFARTQEEHTYVHRFAEIFHKIGLPLPALKDILQGNVRAGETRVVD
jgi:spore maturation protein CgeB